MNRTFNLTILFISIGILCSSCRSHRSKPTEEGRIRPLAYEEGDTLELDPYPSNMLHWVDFYGKRLSGFSNGNFHASGVVLHIDSLPYAQSRPSSTDPHGHLVWNPDSTWYIDYTSDRDGDIDQEVILQCTEPPDRGRSLMFNGPGVTVETADWLGRDVFILSRTTVDMKNGKWSPEICLFSLKDSTFTNFTWTRSVPVDSIMGAADEFLKDQLSKSPINK